MPASLNGNRVILPATSYSSSWSTSVDGSGVKIGKNFNIPAPGGRSAMAEVTSKLTGKAVLTIGAKALAAASGVGAAAGLAYELYDALRVKPDGSGGLTLDPGKPPSYEEGECYMVNGEAECMASGALVGFAKTKLTTARQGQECDVRTVINNSDTSITVQLWYKQKVTNTDGTFCVGNESVFSVQGIKTTAMQPYCPPVVDPFDPAYSIPRGAPGADGKCPQGRGSAAPISPEQAADHAAQVERSADVYKQIMDDILDRQPVPIPKGVETKIETVTPSKVQGPTTTTTGPAGVTETATGWDFGRISQDLAEDFNAGRWSETVTVTNPDGSKETTREDGTTPQEEAAKDGDLCAADPGRLGCIGLGEAPTVEVPKATKNVSFSAESIGGGGGCPAPRAIGNLGQFEFTQLCNGLVTVKPLIVLLGLFLSGMIVVNALRA